MAARSPNAQQASAGLRDLIDEHGPWLRSAILRRYGVQEADDLIQEVWLRVAPYKQHAAIRHPRAFLLTIAANLFIDRRNRSGRAARWLEQAQVLQPDREIAPQADELYLREVILTLPRPLRDVFLLSRFGGLSNRQIAEQLGISPKTVEWRMTKALAHCAAQLKR